MDFVSNIVDRLHQTSPHQHGPDTVNGRFCEPRILATGDPNGQLLAGANRMHSRFATSSSSGLGQSLFGLGKSHLLLDRDHR